MSFWEDLLDLVEIAVTFIVMVALFLGTMCGLIVGGSYFFGRPTCYAHWENSGMHVRWSFWGDCQLQMADGRWITDDAYIAMNKRVNINSNAFNALIGPSK